MKQELLHTFAIIYTPEKFHDTEETQHLKISPIENGDVPLSCQFLGMYNIWFLVFLGQNRSPISQSGAILLYTFGSLMKLLDLTFLLVHWLDLF